MTTQKHTPGPWTVVTNDGNCYFLGDPRNQFGDVPEEDGPANARLIAAAPDMLEVLRHWFEWHANHFGDFDTEINSQLLCLSYETEVILKANKC